eukprot:gene2626-2596_t
MAKSSRSKVKKALRSERRKTIMKEPMMQTIEEKRMEALNKCVNADKMPRESLTPVVMEEERPSRLGRKTAKMDTEDGGLKKTRNVKGMKVKRKVKPLWVGQFAKSKKGAEGKLQG